MIYVPKATTKLVKPKPGAAFTRYAMALLQSRGNLMVAYEIAKNRPDWRNTPGVVSVLKAAVAAGTTSDPVWAKPLVEYQTMAEEFIELVRPALIIGQMTGFHRVPFAIRMVRQTAGAMAGWVGEGMSKPVSSLAFDAVTLPWAKVAVIVAITEELARFSQPSAEGVVQQDLRKAISQFLNQQFIDPTVAGGAASPPSITHGITPIPADDFTVAGLSAALAAALSDMAGNGVPMESVYWIMNPQTKINLSMVRTSQDIYGFPSITAGNTLLGYPIVTSTQVAPGDVILVDAGQILMADDGDITLDSSREASLQLDSAPATPPTPLVSLWQQDLIGIKAERYAYWLRANDAAVQMITGVAPAGARTRQAQAPNPRGDTARMQGVPQQGAQHSPNITGTSQQQPGQQPGHQQPNQPNQPPTPPQPPHRP